MAVNVDIQKNNHENGLSVLRRFSRKTKAAGFIRTIRNKRYFSRKPSELRKKNSALARLELTEKYTELQKLGKVAE